MIDDAMDILEYTLRRQVKCVPGLTYDTHTDTLYVELQGINRNFIFKVCTFSRQIYQGTTMSTIAKRILGEYKKFIIKYFFFQTVDKSF